MMGMFLCWFIALLFVCIVLFCIYIFLPDIIVALRQATEELKKVIK